MHFWQAVALAGGTVIVKQDQQEQHFAELASPVANAVAALGQDIPSAQLKKYELSFMYKGSDNGLLALEANAKEMHKEIGVYNLRDHQTDWAQYKGEVVMPVNGFLAVWNTLSVFFIGGEQGDVASAHPLCIKNVKLVEMN